MNLEQLQKQTEIRSGMSFSEKMEEMEELGWFTKLFADRAMGDTLVLTKYRLQRLYTSMNRNEREACLAMAPQNRLKIAQSDKDMGLG